MSLEDFASRIRDHYLGQFREFVREQHLGCEQGAAEVKLLLSDRSELYRHLYCVDFVKNDGGPQVVELQPDRFLKFEPLSGAIGDARLLIDHLRWDDVVIAHDAAKKPQIDNWFERWFDPEDKRIDEKAEFSSVIHSLLASEGSLSIDFGTAPTAAFWEVLDLVATQGGKNIRVSSSRAESEAD